MLEGGFTWVLSLMFRLDHHCRSMGEAEARADRPDGLGRAAVLRHRLPALGPRGAGAEDPARQRRGVLWLLSARWTSGRRTCWRSASCAASSMATTRSCSPGSATGAT